MEQTAQQIQNPSLSPTRATRNYGIDTLRILSMFMVVVLHILGLGGALPESTNSLTASFSFLALLKCMAYCAVDCYALITGYVCIHSKHQYKRLLTLWLQVIFYTIIITSLTAALQPGTVGLRDFYNALLPMITNQYWYFTAYVGLFVLMPFLNKMLLHSTKRQQQALFVGSFTLLSLLPLIAPNGDIMGSAKGCSMLWLVALYLVGAYIKLHEPDFRFLSKKWCLLLYCACILIIWGGVLLNGAGITTLLHSRFLTYTSPFVVLSAVGLFLFFLQCRFRSTAVQKSIRFFAPISFGVYLIHTNPVIFQRVLKGAFAFYQKYPVWLSVLFVLLTALGIYLTCSLLDYLRLKLFSLCKMDRLCQWIVDTCNRIGAYVYNWVECWQKKRNAVKK